MQCSVTPRPLTPGRRCTRETAAAVSPDFLVTVVSPEILLSSDHVLSESLCFQKMILLINFTRILVASQDSPSMCMILGCLEADFSPMVWCDKTLGKYLDCNHNCTQAQNMFHANPPGVGLNTHFWLRLFILFPLILPIVVMLTVTMFGANCSLTWSFYCPSIIQK